MKHCGLNVTVANFPLFVGTCSLNGAVSEPRKDTADGRNRQFVRLAEQIHDRSSWKNHSHEGEVDSMVKNLDLLQDVSLLVIFVFS